MNIEHEYLKLLKDILDNGVGKEDRTGTGTISVFGRQIRHDMSKGFPLLTTKRIYTKGVIHELLWFLKGDTNIKYLVENNVNIWNSDAYKNYYNESNSFKGDWPDTQEDYVERVMNDEKFAKEWGDLGPIYGKQWVSCEKVSYYDWGSFDKRYRRDRDINQIQNALDLLKHDPDSRRNMVNAWNVSELDDMVLPPCHYGFQLYTTKLTDEERYHIWFTNNYETGMERYFDPEKLPNFDDEYYEPTPERKLSLMWNQRSVDSFLGLPFNIASYGLLLHMFAHQVNMIPHELIGNLGDTHIYKNHIDQVREQLNREIGKLPKLSLEDSEDIFSYCYENVKFNNYNPQPTIKGKLST